MNAHLELIIRPKAKDGSTGVLLPFAVSVPLFRRAEVGLGSCYAGFWASKDAADGANADSSSRRPSGLCPFFLAGKLLLFPWFRDPHSHPALAVEYLFEYQAGPFGGVNQLGLPGPLSKVSLAYRHPLGRLELSGAASVLVDHESRAGTLQFGGHIGYRLPVGEHFWIFGQVMAQVPSWGPLLADGLGGTTFNLAPPVAGTAAVGVQQRADFGFGAGFTLMLTQSNLETRIDLLFRLLSFEIGPHIKPLIAAREKKDAPQKVAVSVRPQLGPQYECPLGYVLASQPPAEVPSPPPAGAANSNPSEPKCILPPPRYHVPSPRWGEPCYLAPLDGSPFLRMGNIDATGQYCEWDGLRLPLGAMIDPPQRVPQAERAKSTDPVPTSQRPAAQATPVPSETVAQAAPSAKAHRGNFSPRPAVAASPPLPQQSAKPMSPHARQDRFERVTEEPPSVPGSPFASGFVDGAKESHQHARDLYQAVKQHGPSVDIPSREAAEAWLREIKEQCLDHLDDCVREKAEEAAQELNDFRKKPWEDKKYAFGHWGWSAFEMTVETLAAGAIPGAGTVVRVGEAAVERAAAKGAANAAGKKAGKEALEEVAEHGAETAARKAARETAEAEAKQRTVQKLEEEAVEHAPNFDAARRRAFERAGMTNPQDIEFTKVDPKTGTVVEFKGRGGAKVAYDPPHSSPGPGHDKPHVGWQTGGKRGNGGTQRGNITYDGPQHPHRATQKGLGDITNGD